MVERGDRELGQQTSFRLGADGHAHIVYFDVAGDRPLMGSVFYGVGEPAD